MRLPRAACCVLLVLALPLFARCAPAAVPSSLPAAAPAAAPAARPAGKPAGWDELVAAARQEGSVRIHGPQGQDFRRVIVDEFQRAFPDIKVDYTAGRLSDLWPRMQAERAAGRYLWDVNVSGGNFTPLHVKPAGGVAPLEPALLLPEVLDESAWFDHRLWWADTHEPYTTLAFQGSVNNIVVYNKDLVNPAQLTSYWDLLDPKWKGKMASTDMRSGTVGVQPLGFIYGHPTLGPEFIERLFSEMDLALSSDQRQLVDWLAQGQYALGLFLSPNAVLLAIEQGLPIDFAPGDRFQEGASIGPSSGGISLIDSAPNANAARVFINWLLSPEGQIAWQRHVKGPSLRVDIPKDGLYPALVPTPGRRYVDASTEAFGALGEHVLHDLVARAVQRARR